MLTSLCLYLAHWKSTRVIIHSTKSTLTLRLTLYDKQISLFHRKSGHISYKYHALTQRTTGALEHIANSCFYTGLWSDSAYKLFKNHFFYCYSLMGLMYTSSMAFKANVFGLLLKSECLLWSSNSSLLREKLWVLSSLLIVGHHTGDGVYGNIMS